MAHGTWTPERIKDLRTRLGLSQPQLAAKLGVSTGAVWRWEKGDRAPDYERRLALMKLEDEMPGADSIGRSAMDAVKHAERRNLSPLALALAGNAAIESAHGMTASEWIISKRHIEQDMLEAAISELIGAGLWPWS